MTQRKKATTLLILEFIRKNQTATAQELSFSLGVTRATITYHLRRLRGGNLIELIPPHMPASRGRAEQRFQLAIGERANNYQVLCQILLNLVESETSLSEDVFSMIGQNMAEALHLGAGLPAQRLNRLCAHLNRQGYQASWIAGRQGAQIIFKNCPYAELLSKTPGLCQMDCSMLSRILSSTFVQIEKISFHSGMVGACRFSTKS